MSPVVLVVDQNKLYSCSKASRYYKVSRPCQMSNTIDDIIIEQSLWQQNPRSSRPSLQALQILSNRRILLFILFINYLIYPQLSLHFIFFFRTGGGAPKNLGKWGFRLSEHLAGGRWGRPLGMGGRAGIPDDGRP